jgi:hypothetical protein
MPVGQDQWQPSQATDVGHDREFDLAHRELRVRTGVPDVHRADQVDTTTDAPAVYRRDDRGAAVGDHRDRLLHALEVGMELGARPGQRAVGE